MKLPAITLLIYAFMLLFGGMFAYVKYESVPSIVMGSLFAALTLGSAFLCFGQKRLGLILSVIGSIILALFFGFRFRASFVFMPSGMMTILSLITCTICYRSLQMTKKS